MNLLSPLALSNLGLKALRIFEIALVFECLVWLVNRQVEQRLKPLLALDVDREPTWRIRRREKLRRGCRGAVRAVFYLLAAIMILDVFGVRVDPLLSGLLIAAAVAVVAARNLLADIVSGFALLAGNHCAPGDEVTIHGVRGRVEEFSLQTVAVRSPDGALHVFANRDVRDLVNHSDVPRDRSQMGTDPLAKPPQS